jgi:hypothetical protein
MVEPAAIAEVEEAKEVEEVKEAEGKKVATLKVTVFDNIPSKIEFIEKLEGFSFRHIKLAKVGMNRCFRKLRREESAKPTEIETKQRLEDRKQQEIDRKTEAELKRLKESATPTREEIRHVQQALREGKR